MGDDLTTVLYAPYHMVVNITHTGPVSNNICFHTYSISYQTHVCKHLFLSIDKKGAIPLGN
jgi:hypothetical protein